MSIRGSEELVYTKVNLGGNQLEVAEELNRNYKAANFRNWLLIISLPLCTSSFQRYRRLTLDTVGSPGIILQSS
jgi:hypothetical protein